MALPPVRNLLFDLGGVLYAVNYGATVVALSELATKTGGSIAFSQAVQDPIFDRFEVGGVDSESFRDALRQLAGASLASAEIDRAWNAMLGGVFPGRHHLIGRLAEKYPLALLSNTNAIHWEHRVGMEVETLLQSFSHVFLSYTAGKRKPNPDFFQLALEKTGWHPAETLFIEDTVQHIESARRLGFQTVHLTRPERLSEELAQAGVTL